MLPLVFVEAVRDVRVPQWVCEMLGLAPGATADALGEPIEAESATELDARLLNFAVRLAQSREQIIGHLPAITLAWQPGLDPETVSWSIRTQNCLRREELLGDTDALTTISVQELSWIDGMGMRSILDFAVTAEAALMQMEMSLPAKDSGDQGQLEAQLKYLIGIARQPWAEQVFASDPRFTGLLRGGMGTLDSMIEIAVQVVDAKEVTELVRIIPLIEIRVEQIANLSLEAALEELFEQFAPRQVERKDELLSRFGWLGGPPITLQACGERLGITRERVRQIQAKFLRRLSGRSVFLPQLDKAIRIFEQAAPVSTTDAPKLLVDAGICHGYFSAESVIAAASDLQRKTSLRIGKIKGKKILVADEDQRATTRLFAIARTQSGASGATNVSEVLAQIESEEGISIDLKRAGALLTNLEEIEFLDDQWFWMPGIPKERNRLRNISRRMLSVASPINVSKLRGGVRREFSFRNSAGSPKWTLLAPPVNIMTEWYRRHPEFVVDENNNVGHVGHLEPRKELGDVDYALVDVLRSSPTCVLDRPSIRDACLGRGINPHSLEVALTYSAILDHVEINIWTLRGVSVEPTAISAVRDLNAQKPRQKRVRNFGWTADGKLWISVVTPAYTFTSVFGVPGGVKKLLAGQKFRAVSANGNDFGTVGVSDDGTAYGYQPFLKQIGADEGDTFLLEFNLEEEIVTLRLGDESVLEELS